MKLLERYNIEYNNLKVGLKLGFYTGIEYYNKYVHLDKCLRKAQYECSHAPTTMHDLFSQNDQYSCEVCDKLFGEICDNL